MQVNLSDYRSAAGLVTELVLTAPEVHRGVDLLVDVESLRAFMAAQPSIAAWTLATLTIEDLGEIQSLRSTIREIMDDPRSSALVSRSEKLTSAAIGSVGLWAGADGRKEWIAYATQNASAADVVALVAGIGILGTVKALGADRVRSCASPTCRGVFIDTSRGGGRRYCMPDVCGNRINVANHRTRQRDTRQR